MKTLPTTIKKYGFTHTQIAREGMFAVYEKTKPTMTNPSYEVIRITVAKPCHRFGTDYPEREMYPCDSDWGKLGWTETSKERAFNRMDALMAMPVKVKSV